MKVKMCKIAVLSFFMLSVSSSAYSDDEKVEKKFKECVAVRMKEINVKHLAKEPEKYSTKIPPGWTVVSGSGGEGHPKVLLCR